MADTTPDPLSTLTEKQVQDVIAAQTKPLLMLMSAVLTATASDSPQTLTKTRNVLMSLAVAAHQEGGAENIRAASVAMAMLDMAEQNVGATADFDAPPRDEH
ncbi:hypothetical protein IMZ29_10500 [Achromobacter sp. GG226]|uniref:hypothetical protein n=1 Tax=Verticiella alkaliphila TaxID=2779529 RepID=UPI001C0D9BD7|nr:hypothetical protein [Verticiella sp. GG226]MBU4610947.1 hypothetical protein [Verticiella sp. GG226]